MIRSHSEIDHWRSWATVELALPASEFDRLTPGEFAVRIKHWQARERRKRADVARLCYVVAVSAGARAADGSALTPAHFMDDIGAVTKKKKPKRAKQLSGRELEEQFIACLPKEWRPSTNGK